MALLRIFHRAVGIYQTKYTRTYVTNGFHGGGGRFGFAGGFNYAYCDENSRIPCVIYDFRVHCVKLKFSELLSKRAVKI